MADTIRINDIPVTTSARFSDNDLFLIVDDGEARLLQRPTFQAWMLQNVQGEKGDQGIAGSNGANGVNGTNGTNGQDGLSAYQVAVKNGYVGTETQWLLTLKGSTGANGANGFNGWSPVITVVPRGDDYVLRLNNWIGGTGTPPTTTGYLSATGIVSNIANATNVRGMQGVQGVKGEKGDQGVAGKDGQDAAQATDIVIQQDHSVIVTYNNDTVLQSNTPPRILGWASYKDGQYTDIAPFTIATNTTSIIPNNSGTVINNGIPINATKFYDNTTQKCIMIDPMGLYAVRVKFKVAPSNSADRMAIIFSKNTTENPYTEDRTLRGDSQIQDMNFSTIIYGDTALQSNGMIIQLRTFNRAVSIYNIEFTISKII